jgi:hypothetical protein
VRLDAEEVAALPLRAALLDARGDLTAATPEWSGPGPACHVYRTGGGQLVVAPDVPAPPLDGLLALLLDALDQLAGQGAGCRAAAGGLALLGGRPLASLGEDRAGAVLHLAAAAIGSRTQGLAVAVRRPVPALRVPAPGAVALALVQLALNAWQHEAAEEVALRAAPGPTLCVEWAAGGRTGSGKRPISRPGGWGWGYVRMVADALGGSALPPEPARSGRRTACLGLGSIQLPLPLACLREGEIERCTSAWERLHDGPALGRPPEARLEGLIEAARRRPARIAVHHRYRARSLGGRVWLALAPLDASARVRGVLRGLRHERSLWAAPEPQATRVHALAILLAGALGDPLPAAPPSVWDPVLPRACAALGMPPHPPVAATLLPDPRLTAYLLSTLGGQLVLAGEEVRLRPARRDHPARAALRVDGAGLLRLIGPDGPPPSR